MSKSTRAELLAQLERLMQEVVETHKATGRSKEAIDREKILLDQEVENEMIVIRDLQTNFDNSAQQLRRHITSLYHDTHRELEALRKEHAVWKNP
jgi:hypothetical protein